MSDAFTKALTQQWQQTQAELSALRREMNRVALQIRAEVAASTPIYADVASLPTGALGMVATVEDDGSGSPALYWYGDSGWQKVTP